MNDRVEDILYESYNLGLRDKLFEEWNKVKAKFPHMETVITLDEAWRIVLNEYKAKNETRETNITPLPPQS